MPPTPIDVVFVHGWSVTSTDTYGGLPSRLIAEAARFDLALRDRHVFLGRYISFHDEVRIADIAAAMEAAVEEQALGRDGRFICVTHSTGGPVVREWHERFYAGRRRSCPMSHLVMLAPANFGSALAQLGKGRIGRIKAWFGGIEPGQGVLDWLELGSAESFELNRRWIRDGASSIGPAGVFPFVLTGQTIDRKLYDNLNSYTGELGSDGVVRVAAASLRASYLRLMQIDAVDSDGYYTLRRSESATAAAAPLRVVRGRSHSGKAIGIMRGVRPAPGQRSAAADTDTVDSILRCFTVRTQRDYDTLAADFERETGDVQREERVEHAGRILGRDRIFIHDRCCQIVFRLSDSDGRPIDDFDLLLTAGEESDPNHLPAGFFRDRQCNRLARNTLTYFLNHDVITGCDEIPGVRPRLDGIRQLGIIVYPRPESGFVRYRKCRVSASASLLGAMIRPNETTLIDIVLERVVDKETFKLDRTMRPTSFKPLKPSGERVE
jgi:hypothetical protein